MMNRLKCFETKRLRGVLLAAALLLPFGLRAADARLDAMWNAANDSYTSGAYTDAVRKYGELIDGGAESAKLYYNLGNAYYKLDSLGKSILYYNKALKMSPGDADIRHNLEVASARTVNRIDEIPEFVLVRWFRELRQLFSSNTWAVISLAFFGISLLMAVCYLLSSTVFRRKFSFTLGVIAVVLFVYALANSICQKRDKLYSGDAIVLSSAAAVKSSPDNGGKDVFILNEGAKVEILSSIGPWSEIVIASGNKGWIETQALGRISE